VAVWINGGTKLKILFVLPEKAIGGSETQVSTLVDYLIEQKHFAEVFFIKTTQPSSSKRQKNIISNLRTLLKLRRLVGEKDWSLVYPFTHRSIFFVALSTIFMQKRPTLLAGVRGLSPRHESFFYRHLFKLSISRFDALTVNAEHLLIYHCRNELLPKDRVVRLVRNSISQEFINAAGSQVHYRDNKRFVVVSNLLPNKNLGFLIDSFANLDTDFKLEIFGDGPERLRLEELINSNSLNDRVRLRGHVVMNPHLFARFGWGIMTSSSEGTSNAASEMMICGIPLIVPNLDWSQPIIKHVSQTLVFQSGDPKSLMLAINQAARMSITPDDRHCISISSMKMLERFPISSIRSVLTSLDGKTRTPIC
jgi:glycosyltransferase involved in cell wall biosynthesis